MKYNKTKTFLSILIALIFVCISTFAVIAQPITDNLSVESTRYYLGEVLKTGHDNGFSGEEKITDGDPHYGWTLGEFYAEGFTSEKKDSEGNLVFLKNAGDTVSLCFDLQQDIDKLNNNENLSISVDNNGYDDYFTTEKTDFGRGALIIRKTDYNNHKGEPTIYTDFLSAKATNTANTVIELCEEGDYEVALDYEIVNNPRKVFGLSIVPTYTNYRVFFKFSVRNGNCMFFPFDVSTGQELANSDFTDNGFYIDMAKSRYLDINIKKEVLNEGANGLVEDVRFNRPAKDGECYTDEGIYTISVSNRYTGETTVKKIYVGNDKVMRATVVNDLSVEEINEYISNGAVIDDNGIIALPTVEEDTKVKESTMDSIDDKLNDDKCAFIIIGVIAVVIVVFVIVFVIKKRKKSSVDLEQLSKDSEV